MWFWLKPFPGGGGKQWGLNPETKWTPQLEQQVDFFSPGFEVQTDKVADCSPRPHPGSSRGGGCLDSILDPTLGLRPRCELYVSVYSSVCTTHQRKGASHKRVGLWFSLYCSDLGLRKQVQTLGASCTWVRPMKITVRHLMKDRHPNSSRNAENAASRLL